MAITTITNAMVSVNAIQGTLIADNAITAVHIATNAVSGTLIADNAVTATHIAQNTITVTQLADDAVEADKIADGVITTNHLNKAMISSQTEVTAVGGDFVLIGDTSDSNNLKKALVSDFGETSRLPLAGGTMTGDLILNDSVKLEIGSASGGDLQIYHDGSDSYITDTGTGNLLIQYSDLYFSKDAGSTHSVVFRSTGRVGIGTTSPVNDLHIAGAASTAVYLKLTNATTGNTANDGSAIGIDADGDLIIHNAEAKDAKFYTSDTERMRITSGGEVGIGTTSVTTNFSPEAHLQVGTAGTGTRSHLQLSTATNGYPAIHFGDGSGAAAYRGWVTYAHPDDAMTFGTAGAERMRFNSSGRIGHGTTSPGFNYDMIYSDTTLGAMRLQNQGAFGTYNTLLQVDTFNSASANFQYLVCHSGNGSAINDIEFNLRGDANAYADGSWNGGGADYAEYFEWQDGNSSNEDRIGHSVSLAGNKIKIAESGETVIGVISGNPAVVGDTGWNKWHDKYQKDDYGRYLRDESGDKLVNTDYEDTKEYVTREARKEWDIVGLMGKLRIKKGQQTGTNWIKMRDISASVEEWLVR